MDKPVNPASSIKCEHLGCIHQAAYGTTLCREHFVHPVLSNPDVKIKETAYTGNGIETKLLEAWIDNERSKVSTNYPKYYRSVTGLDTVDVYQVHKLFDIQDPSGAIQHASKKLLLSGMRTGGKSQYDDIREARDTLNRWLEMNKP